ncbi:LexA family transcriptional regulator [Pseudomonas putida]|uniref:LexA family transcriptional regulator n=1 Tax=Pseudomonas putida group TaxID=136845 RepID=UPI0018A96BC7|nr:LexA family transcriptional regulator [Pseudomonas monteilii]MBF8747719.1 transcriptional regulator [Pseudomonas monteilii]
MNRSGERLKALLQECGLTSSDFAAQRGISPQHVNNWYKRGIPFARLDELADVFCVNRRWLQNGEGPKHPAPMLRSGLPGPQPIDAPALLGAQSGYIQQVPLHALYEGSLVPVPGNYLPLPAQALQTLGISSEAAICVAMPGSNMAPLIPSGAIVAIDRSLTQVIEGETYALLHDGVLRVNSLSLGQQGTLCLHSHDRNQYATERYTQVQRQAQRLQVLGWVFHWSHFRGQRPGGPC